MEHNQDTTYGGDLHRELVEIEKVSELCGEGALEAGTHTAGCTTFLTIYCC